MDIFLNILIAVCIIGLVVCFIMLGYIIVTEISKCFLRYEENPVTVTIVDKQYRAAYSTTTFIRVGKVTTPQIHHHPEEYNVYVEWRGEIYPIDDEEFFDNFEVDDTVLVTAHVGYNKSGVEKDVYLTYE